MSVTEAFFREREVVFSGDYLKENMFCILDTIKEQCNFGEKYFFSKIFNREKVLWV